MLEERGAGAGSGSKLGMRGPTFFGANRLRREVGGFVSILEARCFKLEGEGGILRATYILRRRPHYDDARGIGTCVDEKLEWVARRKKG